MRVFSQMKKCMRGGKKICRNVVQMNFNDIIYLLVADKSDLEGWK